MAAAQAKADKKFAREERAGRTYSHGSNTSTSSA
jgi:hypothetical protein